jgi:hypothetical protein
VSEANNTPEKKDAAARPKKAYTPPTLTECGSVAKLTMAKGTTDIEISPNKKRAGCL